MASLRGFFDGIQNAVTRLGTSKDKGAQNRHFFIELTRHDIAQAYQSSWLARQIVEIPADDATRKWREWEGESAPEIAELERTLDVAAKVRDASRRARLWGGSTILIGAGAPSLEEPLDLDDVKLGGLSYLTVFDAEDLTAEEIDLDPTSERFGQPTSYRLTTNASFARIHHSRLAHFRGARRPYRAASSLQASSYGWDLSVLQACIDAIRNHDASMGYLATLIAEAKSDVLQIPGLAEKVMDPGFEDALVKRMEVAQMLKSVHRREAIDKEEDMKTTTYGFAGIGEAIDRFSVVAAGSADIPMTRLFGQSPGGFQSTGESDLANYYDQVASRQTNDLGPAMWSLDECLIRAATGERPEDARYSWRPLRQMTEVQEAEVIGKRASAFASVIQTAVFPDDSAGAIAGEIMGPRFARALNEDLGDE